MSDTQKQGCEDRHDMELIVFEKIPYMVCRRCDEVRSIPLRVVCMNVLARAQLEQTREQIHAQRS